MILPMLLACGDPAPDSDPGCNSANEACEDGDCECEGGLSLPGSVCESCHSEGELSLSVSGTVWTDLDGGAPLPGATVRVEDAAGEQLELSSNAAGNFASSVELVPPLRVEVESAEGTMMMDAAQRGSCNGCHSCDGEAGGKLYGR